MYGVRGTEGMGGIMGMRGYEGCLHRVWEYKGCAGYGSMKGI